MRERIEREKSMSEGSKKRERERERERKERIRGWKGSPRAYHDKNRQESPPAKTGERLIEVN